MVGVAQTNVWAQTFHARLWFFDDLDISCIEYAIVSFYNQNNVYVGEAIMAWESGNGWWRYTGSPQGAAKYRIHVVPEVWFDWEGGVVDPEWWPNPLQPPAWIDFVNVNTTNHNVFFP